MLQQVISLLIQAVPTFLAIIALHWYLKATLFQPVEKVLEERHAATGGAKSKAGEALAAAEKKVAEYDAKLRDARTELYREQEAWRNGVIAEQNSVLSAAREENQQSAAAAKAAIEREAESARATLEEEASRLADAIVASVLQRGKA